jgi:hypothetical protein
VSRVQEVIPVSQEGVWSLRVADGIEVSDVSLREPRVVPIYHVHTGLVVGLLMIQVTAFLQPSTFHEKREFSSFFVLFRLSFFLL